MPRPPSRSSLLALVALAGFAAPAVAQQDFDFHHENVMGTSLELRVEAIDAAAASAAEARVLAEIDRLSRILSGYDPDSEFSRWQDGPRRPVPVSPELLEVLRAADAWRVAGAGAFDPRVAAFSRLWSVAEQQGRTPTAAELSVARSALDTDAWRLDPRTGTATYLGSGPLSLDGIAKGDIVERAAARALDPAHGVRSVVLNVGGDLRVSGPVERRIGIAPSRGDSLSAEPVAYLRLRDGSVSTSGDAYRGYRIAGRRYSHILDPRSGQPVTEVVSASVVAPRGVDSDALATLFNVLPVAESLRLADGQPGVACRIVDRDGRVFRNARWAAIEEPATALLARATPTATAPASATWSDRFELVVSFEINRPLDAKGGYRRPYVVVWVEDEKGRAVRTLLAWISLGGSGPDQWLPDLSRWYRGDGVQTSGDRKGIAYTIGRPTRPPGQYSVAWDGKNDKGQPTPPGRYTVLIEAAREHGTHQLLRRDVTLADRPFVEKLEGGIEIRSAGIELRDRSAADE